MANLDKDKTPVVWPKTIFFAAFVLFMILGLGSGLEMGRRGDVSLLAYWNTKAGMQIIISVVLLAATLFVILSKRYAARDKHWAYTTVGLIIGFWLKP